VRNQKEEEERVSSRAQGLKQTKLYANECEERPFFFFFREERKNRAREREREREGQKRASISRGPSFASLSLFAGKFSRSLFSLEEQREEKARALLKAPERKKKKTKRRGREKTHRHRALSMMIVVVVVVVVVRPVSSSSSSVRHGVCFTLQCSFFLSLSFL
jgi:hypothetical protein